MNCLGDKVQRLINVITLGMGKRIATKVSNFLGFEDCGCSKRQEWLNNKFGCNKDIKLL